MIESRGIVKVIFSTTSGNSRRVADKFIQDLQHHVFIPLLINIGDIDPQDILSYNGTIVFILSTYGNGDSPYDGESFLNYIQNMHTQHSLQNLNYAILGLGNKTFQNFCGFSVRTQKVLSKYGAKPLLQLQRCNASNVQENSQNIYPKWSQKLIKILQQKNPLKTVPKSSLGSSYKVTLQKIQNFKWQEKVKDFKNIRKQFMTYFSMPKCQVIHIKQLRKKQEDGRSTLWIRAKVPQQFSLSPACNIQVFPINLLSNNITNTQVIFYSELNKKIPFPPMEERQIYKILDLRQEACNIQIKNALLLSKNKEKQQQYQTILKQKKQIKISIQQLINDLQPGLQFLPDVGLNKVRTYTLSSWDPHKKYVDLVVSLVKNGLTSTYFQTHPQYLRMRAISSGFYIPEGRPIVMIANGSGIAPFRSIAEYIYNLPPQKRNFIRLYYGVQNRQNDFYFQEEWNKYQKQGLVQIKLAQSRLDPQNKQYVQHLLQKDQQWLQEHIFKNNGVVFICGAQSMSKEINNIIFKATQAQVKVAYKAFSAVAQLKQKKTIVQQVYG